MIYYIRDEEGSSIGFKYNDTMYYYIKNMQEDIIGITDENFNQIVSYAYDPWGKIISIKDNNNNEITNPSHIGIINPFRYRSYYYDNETKLYYLNSRYYNPEWGRFINVDETTGEIGNIMSHNMYMYAYNNPMSYQDSEGNIPKWLKNAAKKVLIGAAALAVGAVATLVTGGLGVATTALVSGLSAATVAGAAIGGARAITKARQIAKPKIKAKVIVKETTKEAVKGFANGFMTGGIMSGTSQVISAGFKAAASYGVPSGKGSGIEVGPVNILSPDKICDRNKFNGGTLINFNNGYRIDVGSSSLLHSHVPGSRAHIPFGIIISSMLGAGNDED